MYIIELLIKYFKKDKFMEVLEQHDEETALNPLEEIPEIDSDEYCEHLFMPVDSTGETLACSKCGLIVNKKDLKYKNFFMNKNL